MEQPFTTKCSYCRKVIKPEEPHCYENGHSYHTECLAHAYYAEEAKADHCRNREYYDEEYESLI